MNGETWASREDNSIHDSDIVRVLERLREFRSEIIEGTMPLTDFEVDVIITGLEIAGGV